MRGNYQMEYNVDMVFCIDVTASMGDLLDKVKERALHFYEDVMKKMEEKNKSIQNMRIRVIAFRDYLADAELAMMATQFFRLPEQAEEFKEAISSLEPLGGGDIPEDGLEALAYAIKSGWNKEGDKRRSIIVLWTDASTHEIGYAKKSAYYPKGMPQTFSELTAWWGDVQIPSPYIENAGKRLVLFAPKEPYWEQISATWNNVIHYPAKAGDGIKEYTYSQILDAISNSF